MPTVCPYYAHFMYYFVGMALLALQNQKNTGRVLRRKYSVKYRGERTEQVQGEGTEGIATIKHTK
jgi:hypothetical protein